MGNAATVGGVKSLTISNGTAPAIAFDVESASVMPGGRRRVAVETATGVVFTETVAKSQIRATVKTRGTLSPKAVQAWDEVSATLVSSNGRAYRITEQGAVVDAIEVDVVEGSMDIVIEADPQFFSESRAAS